MRDRRSDGASRAVSASRRSSTPDSRTSLSRNPFDTSTSMGGAPPATGRVPRWCVVHRADWSRAPGERSPTGGTWTPWSWGARAGCRPSFGGAKESRDPEASGSGVASMNDAPSKGLPPPSAEHPTAGRLDSWKEIAAYLRRDVTTVQRWERREGMPVHRHQHDKMGSVFAFASELDAWTKSRSLGGGPADAAKHVEQPEKEVPPGPEVAPETGGESTVQAPSPTPAIGRRGRGWFVVAACAVLAAAIAIWLVRRAAVADNPLAGARFQRLTDFDGIEQAAGVSRDGRFVS